MADPIIQEPTGVSPTAATLHGEVDPGGVDSVAYFEYGLTLAYGLTTPRRTIGNGSGYVPVQAHISSLSPATVYHCRVVRDDFTPSAFGDDLEAAAPRLPESTGSTTNVSSVSALEAALESVDDGDWINITADLNGGGAQLAISRVASFANPITITSDPGVEITNFSQWYVDGSFLRFRDLDMSGCADAAIKPQGDYIEVDHCDLHDNQGQGILIGSGATNWQLWNNSIKRNGSHENYDHGIYAGYTNGTPCVIANNEIFDNWAYNLQLYPNDPYLIVTCNTVDGGEVHDDYRGGVVLQSNSGETHDCLIVGLITTNAPNSWGLHVQSIGSSNRCAGSIAFGNAFGSFQEASGIEYFPDPNLTADPEYVNGPGGDYHLMAGSPAIDLIPVEFYGYVPAFDRDGNARVTADAGCYAA